jgi:hypothetical protein
LVYFFDSFRYQNGFRFVGRNYVNKPLDIYWDSTTNSFTNINKIKTSFLYQENNRIIYLDRKFLFYSTDNGNNFDSIPFPDSLLKSQNPAIMYLNSVQTIISTGNNNYLILKYAALNQNDSIYNPNREKGELIFFNFNINNNSLDIKKILSLGNDFTINISLLPDNKYLLYAFRTSNKIRILNSSLNEIYSKYLNFFPSYIYTKNDSLWIASTQKDTIFITTDAGTTWMPFNLTNDTLLYDNKSKSFNKIFNVKDNDFILIGSNRITLLSLKIQTKVVDKKNNNTNNLLISPNPATDYIDVILKERQRLKTAEGSGVANPNLSVKVYDVRGNVVVDTPPGPLLIEGERIRLDVSGLAAGVYFVRVDGKMYKFVKM